LIKKAVLILRFFNMCLNFTIHNGYLRDPLDMDRVIPFEDIIRAWACTGESYCCFLARIIDKDLEIELFAKISKSVGVVFAHLNHPDFAMYDKSAFVNFRFVKTVHKNITERRTYKFEIDDDIPFETSVRKASLFFELYEEFKLREELKNNLPV